MIKIAASRSGTGFAAVSLADDFQALGFCFFNNVAVAARQYRRLFDRRILILDWVGHVIQGVCFHWYPPKKLKYGKPGLGESMWT